MPSAAPCMPAMGNRCRDDRISRGRKSDSTTNGIMLGLETYLRNNRKKHSNEDSV